MQIACPHCQSQNLKVHQKNGHAYSTMYRCVDCQRFFSQRRFTGYSGLRLPPEKVTQILNRIAFSPDDYHSAASNGKGIASAWAVLALGAFLKVRSTCRRGGMSMPSPDRISATVRI